MSSSGVLPLYHDVDGIRVAEVFSADVLRSALAYKPRPGDLFIVTYPKCGTTWMQYIVACIFRHGEPFSDALEFFTQTPFLEMTGASGALTMKRPGAIKLHQPFHRTPYNPEAKYIFVTRNPKDCCVSLYHHTRSIAAYKFEDGKFDDFFELFIRDKAEFGNYFDTLLSWYDHRNDPNVLFLTYEQLKEDTKKYVLEIAGFIWDAYREKLEQNPELLNKVIKHSSFAYMKETLNKQLSELEDMPKELIINNPDLPEGLRRFFSGAVFKSKSSSTVTFIRKGVVGDWRNIMSEEQSKRLEEIYKERIQGTDIPKLWEKYM